MKMLAIEGDHNFVNTV